MVRIGLAPHRRRTTKSYIWLVIETIKKQSLSFYREHGSWNLVRQGVFY